MNVPVRHPAVRARAWLIPGGVGIVRACVLHPRGTKPLCWHMVDVGPGCLVPTLFLHYPISVSLLSRYRFPVIVCMYVELRGCSGGLSIPSSLIAIGLASGQAVAKLHCSRQQSRAPSIGKVYNHASRAGITLIVGRMRHASVGGGWFLCGGGGTGHPWVGITYIHQVGYLFNGLPWLSGRTAETLQRHFSKQI